MATINFQLEVPHGREGDFFAAMASFFTSEKVPLSEQPKVKPIEKAVKADPAIVEIPRVDPAPVETATPTVEAQAEQAEKETPSYTITTIRAKAKEVAGTKGNEFIREALQHVGASSLSKIPEDKFTEFMDFLTGGDE